MGGKCPKNCKDLENIFPCFKKSINLENEDTNPNNPSTLNNNNPNISIRIVKKETLQIDTKNTEKAPLNNGNINVPNNYINGYNNFINISQKKNPYFSNDDLIKIYKILEDEKNLNFEKIKIRRYKIGNLIGQGSYGKVYEALDEERGQLIAVKIIDKKRLNSFSSNSNSSISSIESEIEILSKLNHKNIIKYYGSLQSKNHLKIFLEYCEGGSIAKMLLNYKSFTENIIRKYTKEMLEGLEYLHAHNIIHRDIKGANILVDRNGTCKLSDFGGAKIIKDEEFNQSRNYSMKGTPNWMAPEVIKNNETTRFSDIWSIGCTVIEMITGKPPWSNYKNPFKILFQIMNSLEPPEIPNNCSGTLSNFISCCLKVNPTERLNVTQLLRHPFILGTLTQRVKEVSSDFVSNLSGDVETIIIQKKISDSDKSENGNFISNINNINIIINEERNSEQTDNDINVLKK